MEAVENLKVGIMNGDGVALNKVEQVVGKVAGKIDVYLILAVRDKTERESGVACESPASQSRSIDPAFAPKRKSSKKGIEEGLREDAFYRLARDCI